MTGTRYKTNYWHLRPRQGRLEHVAEDGKTYTTLTWFAVNARPGYVVPSKANGRKGTRRAWKRAHSPTTWRKIWSFFDVGSLTGGPLHPVYGEAYCEPKITHI